MSLFKVSPPEGKYTVNSSEITNKLLDIDVIRETYLLRFQLLYPITIVASIVMMILVIQSISLIFSGLLITFIILLYVAGCVSYVFGLSQLELAKASKRIVPVVYITLINIGLAWIIFLKRANTNSSELIFSLFVFTIISTTIGLVAYTFPFNIQENRIQRARLANFVSLIFQNGSKEDKIGTVFKDGLTGLEADSLLALLGNTVIQPFTLYGTFRWMLPLLGPTIMSIILIVAQGGTISGT